MARYNPEVTAARKWNLCIQPWKAPLDRVWSALRRWSALEYQSGILLANHRSHCSINFTGDRLRKGSEKALVSAKGGLSLCQLRVYHNMECRGHGGSAPHISYLNHTWIWVTVINLLHTSSLLKKMNPFSSVTMLLLQILLRILQVPGSTLGPETVCPDRCLVDTVSYWGRTLKQAATTSFLIIFCVSSTLFLTSEAVK
jgi:hypothetical protein